VKTTLRRTAARLVRMPARRSRCSAIPRPRKSSTPSGRSRLLTQRPPRLAHDRTRLPRWLAFAWTMRAPRMTLVPTRRLRRATRAQVGPTRRSTFGQVRRRRRLTARSIARVRFWAAMGAARMCRRSAATIPRRSGFFFFERFAGPARAFFMRRSRPLPVGTCFVRPRFFTTLTLGPWHATSP
jgi:hypothetical protein